MTRTGRKVLIRQHIDSEALGNVVHVERVLSSGKTYYVELWQTLDASDTTLAKAVNQAIDAFEQRGNDG